jgi:hypothetical protein
MACAPKEAEIHKKSSEDKGVAQRHRIKEYVGNILPHVAVASMEEVLDDGDGTVRTRERKRRWGRARNTIW